MKYIFYFSLALAFISKIIHSTEISENQHNTRYIYVIVPGQGDFGGTEDDGKLPPTIPSHYKEKIRIKTPLSERKGLFSSFSSAQDDFGQENCQKLLHAQLDALFEQSNTKFIIHAYSQGTASILNYISTIEIEDQNKDPKRTLKIEALILESAMISGFSATHHFTSNHFRYGLFPLGKICTWMPYSDRWVPIIAQLTTFPDFDIHGTHTIDILQNIPKLLPIIILHSPDDYILSYEGALGVYQALQEQGNNVSLVLADRKVHIDMMSQNIQRREDKKKFREIQNVACKIASEVAEILKGHGISGIVQEENRGNKPIFDKSYHRKHLTHVSNVRFLYSMLRNLTHPIKAISSMLSINETSLVSITVSLTMLCVSRYIKQT